MKPLRVRVAKLEAKAEEAQKQYDECALQLTRLGASIEALKEEYAVLILEAEQLKESRSTVQQRVGRSVSLLGGLANEQQRWQQRLGRLGREQHALVGDALLAAAFLTYSGFHDQRQRAQLMQRWCERLERGGLPHTTELLPTEFLGSEDARLGWQRDGLPQARPERCLSLRPRLVSLLLPLPSTPSRLPKLACQSWPAAPQGAAGSRSSPHARRLS